MNKHTVIVIIAAVVIVGTLGFTAWNIVIAEQIQFRPASDGTFSYFSLINQEKLSICNPSPIYATFNEVKISMIYEGRNIGTVEFPGVIIDPDSAIIKDGKFRTEAFEEIQYLSMHFDGMFMDAIPTRIDLVKMEIITDIQTQIMGFIPYSVTKHYQGLEFWEMMNGNTESYSCD